MRFLFCFLLISIFLRQDGFSQGATQELIQDQSAQNNAKSSPFRQDARRSLTLKQATQQLGYTLNYDDIPVLQLIKFFSQIAGINFIFDQNDIQFSISIVAEESSSVEDLLATLIQILRMHALSVVEQGNNIIIYANASLSKVSPIVTDENAVSVQKDSVIVTRVFRLFNLSPTPVAEIIRPLLSKDALVEVSEQTRHVIVTDITANIEKISELLIALDTPSAVLDVGQYKVKSAFPNILVAYAKEILTPLAQDNPLQMIAQPSSNTIYIVSTPFLIHRAIEILTSLDSPTITAEAIVELPPSAMVNNNFFVYKLQYHEGRDIALALRDIGANLERAGLANMDLVNTINSMQWIEVNNTLVFSGTNEAIDKIKDLLADLDSRPKQVYIEVLIIDTTLSNSLTFGVEWVALANEQSKLAFATGFLDVPPPGAPSGSLGFQQPPLFGGARDALSSPPPNAARGGQPGTGGDVPLSSGFGLGIIGNIIRHNGESFLTLGALVSALETEDDSTIVLNPRIMTEDAREALFFVGQNIPYQTTTTIIRDTGTVTENIQYEDVGVQLRLIPIISPNNIVTLQIDQSISDVFSATAQVTPTQTILAPTITKTLSTTRVHVPDGAFLVMSGHIRDEKTFSRRGIPCLGTLPLIGNTFSRNTEFREKRNLILFLRPRVLSSPEEDVAFSNEEGYQFNWNSNPCSLRECGTTPAPECQSYPTDPCYNP